MAQTRDERSGRGDIERAQPLQREQSGRSDEGRRIPARREARALSPLDPFGLTRSLRSEMDRFFDNLGLRGSLFPSLSFERGFDEMERAVWSPQIEMYEKDGKIHICADLPGLKKDDVKIDLKDDVLTIHGERRREQRDEEGGWTERSYGSFLRSIPLPEGINAESASALFENGVLNIIFDAPKRQESRGRSIEIREGSVRK